MAKTNTKYQYTHLVQCTLDTPTLSHTSSSPMPPPSSHLYRHRLSITNTVRHSPNTIKPPPSPHHTTLYICFIYLHYIFLNSFKGNEYQMPFEQPSWQHVIATNKGEGRWKFMPYKIYGYAPDSKVDLLLEREQCKFIITG